MENTVNIREITENDAEAIQNIREAITVDDADIDSQKLIGSRLGMIMEKQAWLLKLMEMLWAI